MGPYRLDRPIGSGGMGTVWRAWDERLERWVALKQIHPDATVRHGRERLWREARAAARLNHPSIVHVYDIVEGTDGDWIVMELVEGKTVRCLLDEEKAFSPARAVELCREVTEGLAEAHAQGVLHRDLKASNVIVAPSGRAKILDFGLAKEIPREEGPRDSDLTQSGIILGTCYAMSPEQALGRALDERSDLFSLGSLLYEMLTGTAPFRAETNAVSLARVVDFSPPPLQRSHPEIPLAVCELVDWLLRKEPHNRPRSAAEVLAVLRSAANPAQSPARPILSDEPTAAVSFAERWVHPADALTLENGPRQRGGERRTVTIVCCGLVQLDRSGDAGALEIEALSEAAIAFGTLGREICQELSGSLCGVLNRTLWLCFGYPQAHEDDAERGVRAARELQARFAAVSEAAAHRLAVRTGVHTGPAVVVTRPAVGQTLQLGDTFDIATAIQGQVPAGSIGVSAASRRLLGRRFTTQPLPAVHVSDLDATVEVYELGSPRDREGLEVGAAIPLVNRDAEIQILLDRFRLASSGSGQAVLIAGEAGIGKSRLVRALSERLADEAPTWLVAHGSTYTQNTPLAPVVQLLSRALLVASETSGESPGGEALCRLEEVLDEHGLPRTDYVPLLGPLLSIPTDERYAALVLSPEARRKRTLAAILALLGAMAERHPVVLVIEDLHWIDPSTLEFLDLLLAEISLLPLLLVATFRPELTAPWRHQTSVTQLNLAGLNETHSAQLIERVAEGKGLPAETCREIVLRTDGIPLFVEELTKAVLEAETPLRGPSGIPITLGSSLLARLDRLGEAKAVAQLAAVIGRTFTLEQLEALSWIKGAALQAALGRLLQAEILYRRGPAPRTRYVFKHALIQDTAYLSLLASDRQQLHQQLARLLQKQFPAVAEAEPELMAHHCEHGGLMEEAVEFLQVAGLRAMQRWAPMEAERHLSRALDALLGLPVTPERLGREALLRSLLSIVLGAIRGWGDQGVAVNAERCVALCRELGDRGRLLAALKALWGFNILQANRQRTIDLADEVASLAETPVQIFMGFALQGSTAFWDGRFTEALDLLRKATALYEPNTRPEFTEVFGDDSSLLPHVYEYWALWILGQPEAALRKLDAVAAAVEDLHSSFHLGFSLLFEMILCQALRDPKRTAAVTERLIDLAREQEFAFLSSAAHCGHGWAICQNGDLDAGMAEIRTGLELMSATGSLLTRGFYLSFLIDACLLAGRLEEGLAATREALTRPEDRLDLFCDAELLRLQGELLSAAGDHRSAEAAFRKSLALARDQGARAFELRTATSLGRLLAEQGRIEEALAPLTEACEAFHEGFTTRDLQEARGLIERLFSLQGEAGLLNPSSPLGSLP